MLSTNWSCFCFCHAAAAHARVRTCARTVRVVGGASAEVAQQLAVGLLILGLDAGEHDAHGPLPLLGRCLLYLLLLRLLLAKLLRCCRRAAPPTPR